MAQDQTWRSTYEYRGWRFMVIWSDNGECRCCGSKEKVHAHHILDASTHPELRYEESNGVTLCNTCHKYIHNEIAGGYRYPVNQDDLDILLQLSYHRGRAYRKLRRIFPKE